MAENITVSNCIIYEVYGCPIQVPWEAGDAVREHVVLGSGAEGCYRTDPYQHGAFGEAGSWRVGHATAGESGAGACGPIEPSVVRNISFSNIQGTVTTDPPQLRDATFTSNYNPGERRSCIVLSAVGGSIIENVIVRQCSPDLRGWRHSRGCGAANLPQIAGEYFMLGPMPAYGFYARNSRGITLNNVRFQVATPDLRPAVVLDHVEDAAINGLSVQGNAAAESVMRFTAARDVLFNATRVLTSSPAFLQLRERE